VSTNIVRGPVAAREGIPDQAVRRFAEEKSIFSSSNLPAEILPTCRVLIVEHSPVPVTSLLRARPGAANVPQRCGTDLYLWLARAFEGDTGAATKRGHAALSLHKARKIG